MSIEVTIRQVGFEKKTMPLKTILGADLLYGSYDEGWRLHTGERNENDFLAYMPMQLARGFVVNWNENDMELVRLKALTPTAPAELRTFYETVYRIATYWESEIEVDGRLMDLEDFIDGFEAMLEFNQNTLQKMAKSVIDGENSEMTLFSVMWPLVMGRQEAEAFLVEPSYFPKWLHEKQNIDAYYIKPSFFRREDGVWGRYAISEELRCILPIKPYVPYGFDDPETNELLECNNYGMLIYSIFRSETIGEMPYDDFIKGIRKFKKAKAKRYDGNHIIIEGLSGEDLEEFVREMEQVQ